MVVDENGVVLYHENTEPGLNGYWVEAKDLREGDVFLGANGELSTLVNLERVQFDETIKVYNFTVDGNHNYFVIAKTGDYGQTCILVHNAKCGPEFEYKSPKELCSMTNTPSKKFHDLKKQILKDAASDKDIRKELKIIGTDNPDIWLDPNGTIGLVHPTDSTKSVVTPFMIQWYGN